MSRTISAVVVVMVLDVALEIRLCVVGSAGDVQLHAGCNDFASPILRISLSTTKTSIAPSWHKWAKLWWPNFVLSATTMTSSAAAIIACSVSTSSKLLLNRPRSLRPATLITVRRTFNSPNIRLAYGPSETPVRWWM